MRVERITSIYQANNQYKGFNSYLVGKKRRAYKIESVLVDKPVVKRYDFGKPMDYVIIIAVLVVIGLLNGWIGG
jgi:hypothetical protein